MNPTTMRRHHHPLAGVRLVALYVLLIVVGIILVSILEAAFR